MVSKSSLKPLSLSRRATLQAALAAAIAGKIMGKPVFVAGQAESTGTWNWGGNPGHTGELPGPGLDLSNALGEVWRIPEDEFGYDPEYGEARVTGYANGVIYTMNGDGIWARRLSDGQFLWAQNPARLMETSDGLGAPPASPTADGEKLEFYGPIAIDDNVLLMSVSNGHLWGLDATTGDLRWDFAEDSFFDRGPTIVDHVGYFTLSEGIGAVALTDPPTLSWTSQVDGWILGAGEGIVYVAVDGNEIRALTMENGAEFWRLSLGDAVEIYRFLGVDNGDVFLFCYNRELDAERLIVVNQDGEVDWDFSGSENRWWLLGDTITSLDFADGYDVLYSRYAENGNPNWNLEVSAWGNVSYTPVMCAGKAYALVQDYNRDENVLIAIDPAKPEVHGVRGSLAVPMFMADGIMVAQDDDTGEILAIGNVSAVLQPGGRATLTEDATLRGAPSDSAIERAQVANGTLVDVTGDGETTNGAEWFPVTLSDTSESGWLPASVLAGQDGPIRFSAMELYEFGNFTPFPKFSAGTKAEITVQVELRGAPSETSAAKGTLEAATLVTVTSPPTESESGEWCPIKVDATGDSGWVPVEVLKLAANA